MTGTKVHDTCRVCRSQLHTTLSLGDQYVSNFIAPGETDGIRAPLDLALCSQCHLLQLEHTVPAESLYRNYWYRSGTNQSMRDALADISTKAELLIHLQPGDTVLDIGCNDGTLLASYRTPNLFKIGFDPAKNMYPFSSQVANTVVPDFFAADRFEAEADIATRRPKIVTSIAMFYDLEDPCRFVSDVKQIMHPEGVWIVQMSYLPLMLSQNAFDNICHEHLEYYSLQSLEYLLANFGMGVVDVERNDVNGGSFRVYIRNKGAAESLFGDATHHALAAERTRAFRQHEIELGLTEPSLYREFAARVDRIRQDVVGFVTERVQAGKTVYVYGASTKGNTLLQYFGLDHRLITAAAERNPDKWGKRTVGSHIPIVSEQEARDARPDYFLVLPWHFIDEFERREKEYLMAGGRFILPMPHFTLI